MIYTGKYCDRENLFYFTLGRPPMTKEGQNTTLEIKQQTTLFTGGNFSETKSSLT